MQLAHATSIAGTRISFTLFFGLISIVVSVKSQLASIAQRATQAHCHVTGLTRDVQELDTTKQNLAVTIEVLLMLHSNDET